jgi:hypothetical protein
LKVKNLLTRIGVAAIIEFTIGAPKTLKSGLANETLNLHIWLRAPAPPLVKFHGLNDKISNKPYFIYCRGKLKKHAERERLESLIKLQILGTFGSSPVHERKSSTNQYKTILF